MYRAMSCKKIEIESDYSIGIEIIPLIKLGKVDFII